MFNFRQRHLTLKISSLLMFLFCKPVEFTAVDISIKGSSKNFACKANTNRSKVQFFALRLSSGIPVTFPLSYLLSCLVS